MLPCGAPPTQHSALKVSPGASLSSSLSLVHEARVLEHGVRARLDEGEQLGHLVGNRYVSKQASKSVVYSWEGGGGQRGTV